MNIATLEHYVQQTNQWRQLFDEAPLSLLNADDRQKIADRIDMALSPENLTCDGELTRAQVQKKYTALTRAARELLSIDPNVRMYEYDGE
jgi:hypothetical protein